jgi:peptide/nickel transport system permease protein
MAAQPPDRVARGADLEPSIPHDGLLTSVARWIRLHPSGLIGLGVVLVFLLAAVFAGVLAPYGIDEGDLDNRMAPPSFDHLLGTDKVGRDHFSRLIYGARASMLLAIGAVLVSQTLAAVVGLSSGYFGGWFDLIAQRVIDIWIALPGLLFLIFVIGTIGASTPVVLVVLGLLLFAGSSRVIRGVTLSLKGYPFVEAARGTGASHARVIARHILPNVLPLIVVQATLQLGVAVLIESSLSFLGFGVPPPTPTWGRMLADARGDLASPGGFNLALWPGLAITAVVYSFNMLGDTLHDILEFHQRPRS